MEKDKQPTKEEIQELAKMYFGAIIDMSNYCVGFTIDMSDEVYEAIKEMEEGVNNELAKSVKRLNDSIEKIDENKYEFITKEESKLLYNTIGKDKTIDKIKYTIVENLNNESSTENEIRLYILKNIGKQDKELNVNLPMINDIVIMFKHKIDSCPESCRDIILQDELLKWYESLNTTQKLNYAIEMIASNEVIRDMFNSTAFTEDKPFLDKNDKPIIDDAYIRINSNLKKGEELLSDHKMVKLLESIGTRILNSKPQNEDKENYIKTYTTKGLNIRKSNEDYVLEQIFGTSIPLSYENKEPIEKLLVIPKGTKKPNISKKKDMYRLPEIEMKRLYGKYDVLDAYIDAYNNANKQLDKFKNEDGKWISIYGKDYTDKRNLLRRKIKLQIDMKDYLDSVEPCIKFKNPINNQIHYDDKYLNLDFSNYDDVKSIISTYFKVGYDEEFNVDMNTDLYNTMLSFEDIIKNVNFTDRQKEVFELYKKDYTLEQIGNILGITKQVVSDRIKDIVKKIIRTYENQYEDWYYTFKEKGVYKKCSKCGKTKLIKYFDKKDKIHYRSSCKKCRKNQ